MRFFLGTHHATQRWFDLEVPLFCSRRVMGQRRRQPRARVGWALDSGGFTELSMYGEWRTSVDEYVRDVERLRDEVGLLEWAAPMDWMCEPWIVAKTGLTVHRHQQLTVTNFRVLRDRLGEIVIPVLQGWSLNDYLACWGEYADQGVALDEERLVGLGSVCRRQNTAEAGKIVRRLTDEGLALHGFGVKITGLESFGDVLASADSMAWSYWARRESPLPGCTHKSCANCTRYAVRWRSEIIARLGQLRLEFAA